MHLRSSLKIAFLFLFLFIAHTSMAQVFTLSGKIVDFKTQEPMTGVRVLLKSLPDSAVFAGTASGESGEFNFASVKPGLYLLELSLVGYEKTEKRLQLNASMVLDPIKIQESTQVLTEVQVTETGTRVTQKGDTTEYNANSFKTNPDADAADLVKKMPGITIENGVVKAQGEEVKKVTVDGQEFFGDDAVMALKNLPAEVVDKIQVFDRQSDQSQFTGVSDGNTDKTINIVTKAGKNTGQFGKAYIGYGTDNRYQGGFNMNIFHKKRRISLIGMSNNINQQNFASEDILGTVGASSGGGRGGRGQGGPGRGNDASNFMVGQQNGINTTHSYGINFTDQWGKMKVTASYFFTAGINNNSYVLNRNYFLDPSQVQEYRETQVSRSENFNHRVNMRMEYTIDSNNSILFTPKISFQDNSGNSLLNGNNVLEQNILNRSVTTNQNSGNGLNMNNTLLYRHRFLKERRTFSVSVNQRWNTRRSLQTLYSFNEYNQQFDSVSSINQQTDVNSPGAGYSGELSYTEPLNKKSTLQLNYAPSYNSSISTRYTYAFDTVSMRYSIPDTVLSSDFENNTLTHRAGLGWNYRSEKSMLNVMLNYQFSDLYGRQIFPERPEIRKQFNNVLPSVFWRYQFSKEENLRIVYRSSTQLPSVSQLQGVVDNSNPVMLTSGNPELAQSVSHNFVGRYNINKPKTGRSFFTFFNLGYTADYIGTSTIIASSDTTLPDGTLLKRGSQYSRPENLGGNWRANTFFTWGTPVKKLKSNLNLNAGVGYTGTPGLINSIENLSRATTLSGGAVLGSNISEDIDFSLSYSANYVLVKNSIQPALNNNYYYHVAGLRLYYLYKKKFTFNSDLSYSSYLGLNDGFNQQFTLWNLSAGYKFLKNNLGELRFSVFDVLGQNTSISRQVTETYVQDLNTTVLSRYFSVSFIYQFKNFGVKEAKPAKP